MHLLLFRSEYTSLSAEILLQVLIFMKIIALTPRMYDVGCADNASLISLS